MNISFYPQNPYLPPGQNRNSRSTAVFPGFQEAVKEGKNEQSQKLRDMIRSLYQNPMPGDKENGFLSLCDTSKAEGGKEEKKSSSRYNFKEVETKIQRAKTALSAAQAFLCAKRKVLEIKRKISIGDGDPEDLQTELTHAKRMEMIARKKKHHMELEELVANTQKLDERMKKEEDAASELKNAITAAGEEEVSEQEDAVFEERGEMIEQAVSELNEEGAEIPEEMMDELNEMISEFGEDELEELEKAMEALEDLEAFDPHMTREELEELKRKHRAAEQKAMVKADMDYLKDTIRHQMEKGGFISAVSWGGGMDIQI